MAEDGIKPTGRVTIREVAADAGVSVAAVSKVLRNAYGVSEALRLRVETSIRTLGYRPNMAARGLRGRTFTIGLLLIELDNPFLPQIVDGVKDSIEPAGYRVMIGVSRHNSQIESTLIETMMDYQMDGLILIAPRLTVATLEGIARQIPLVVIAQHVPQPVGFDTVNADDHGGAAQVVQAFVAAGHSDIAMLSIRIEGEPHTNVSEVRENGYRAAMAAAGLADRARIIHVPVEPARSAAEITAILTAPDRPRALFCWSDLHGVLAVNLCHKLGLRVPHDIALAGFDNTPVAAMPLVGLTSVDQSGRTLGALAAQALMDRLGGRTEASHQLLPTRLVRRRSL